MEKETEILNFLSRIKDRVGQRPQSGMELIRIVTLRRLGRELGFEKINLKQGKMYLFFLGDEKSQYFQSDAFGQVLNYMQQNPRSCQLRDQKGKRSMVISNIENVETAVSILENIKKNMQNKE